MGNVFDYLTWRGDVPFSADPFNEVDNLILAELAYVDFKNVPDTGEPVPLKEACEDFFRNHPIKGASADPMMQKAGLMKRMVKDARFRNTRLVYYNNEAAEQGLQFAGVTFLLEDGTAYAAFRGTDSSFASWRESLDLSYLPETEGQRRAVSYLNRLEALPGYKLRVGGHSKGGNYAVYGAAFCERSIQDRIVQVYSNDGPGFHDEVILSDGYRRILPKIINIIPDSSVIGRLLLNASIPRVVKADSVGLAQHNAFTWRVERNRFERTGISDMGMFLDKSVTEWTERLNDQTRSSLIRSIFTLLDGTGMENFRNLRGSKRKSAEALLSGLNELPEKKRQELFQSMLLLLRSGGQTAVSGMGTFLQNYMNEHGPRRGNNDDPGRAQ